MSWVLHIMYIMTLRRWGILEIHASVGAAKLSRFAVRVGDALHLDAFLIFADRRSDAVGVSRAFHFAAFVRFADPVRLAHKNMAVGHGFALHLFAFVFLADAFCVFLVRTMVMTCTFNLLTFQVFAAMLFGTVRVGATFVFDTFVLGTCAFAVLASFDELARSMTFAFWLEASIRLFVAQFVGLAVDSGCTFHLLTFAVDTFGGSIFSEESVAMFVRATFLLDTFRILAELFVAIAVAFVGALDRLAFVVDAMLGDATCLTHFVAATFNFDTDVWLGSVDGLLARANLVVGTVQIVATFGQLALVGHTATFAVFAILTFIMIDALVVGVALNLFAQVVATSHSLAKDSAVIVDSTFLRLTFVRHAQAMSILAMSKENGVRLGLCLAHRMSPTVDLETFVCLLVAQLVLGAMVSGDATFDLDTLVL